MASRNSCGVFLLFEKDVGKSICLLGGETIKYQGTSRQIPIEHILLKMAPGTVSVQIDARAGRVYSPFLVARSVPGVMDKVAPHKDTATRWAKVIYKLAPSTVTSSHRECD